MTKILSKMIAREVATHNFKEIEFRAPASTVNGGGTDRRSTSKT